MPELVLGMQMCLRLSELNHPFWEEGGGKGRKGGKKYDTEGTPGECEMRARCPSFCTLPAAELAQGEQRGAVGMLPGAGPAPRGGGTPPLCLRALVVGASPPSQPPPAPSCSPLTPAWPRERRVAMLVPPLLSTRLPAVEMRRVLPGSAGGPQSRGEERSGREEGCGKRCEPTANWAVVAVVWRLLLTTRYN